jgi:hypothetical protein
MSENLVPLKLDQTMDPMMAVVGEKEWTVLRSCETSVWRQYTATTYSNNNFTINCNPPNQKTLIDRKMYIRVPVNIQFTGTSAAGSHLLQSGNDALRAFPLSTCIQNLQVTLNDSQANVPLYDVIQPLMRYGTDYDLKEFDWSATPTYLDNYANYEDGNLTNRNPLNSYGATAENGQTARGAFPVNPLTFTNTATTANCDFVLTEPLMLSPLYFGHGSPAGLYGIQTMSITVSWIQNLSRMWSHSNAGGNTLTAINVTLGAPTLLQKYETLPKSIIPPQLIVYPYKVIQRYITATAPAVAPGGMVTVNAVTTINSIPQKIYVFAKHRASTETFNTTDTMLGLTSITFSWNTSSGLLSSATQQDLFNISVRNGYNGSFLDWTGGPTLFASGTTTTFVGTQGSVLALSPGIEIPLGEDEAPGMNGQYQIQLTATFYNQNQTNYVTPDVYIVCVSDGTWNIAAGHCQAQIGVVSRLDVVNSTSSPMVAYMGGMRGGGFFQDLKSWFGKFSSNVLPIVSAVSGAIPHPAAQAVNQGLKAFGYGVSGGCHQDNMYGEGLKGGAKVSKASMRKRVTYM